MNRARPYMNRFVKLKEQQIEDSYHSINLREIKPVTCKHMTHNETIPINNSKRDMIKQIRDIEIERQNRVLLQKISSVMSKKGSYSFSRTKNIRTKVNKSLNQFFRKKQMEEIQIENKRFVNRLQQKKPTLNIEKLNKDWNDNKSVIKRMANYEFNLTSIKSNSRVKSITTQKFYKSKYEKMKISKFKNIDGTKMLIKIEFVDDILKITGDVQKSKDLKVIEIPRDEAVTLLEKDCHGKMEKLLDKLRYDAKGDTLYLVTDDLEEGQLDFSEFNPQMDNVVVNKKGDKKRKQDKKASVDNSNKETNITPNQNQSPNSEKNEEKEHVVEKKEDEVQPQEDKYEQQRFTQSNIAEKKGAEAVAPVETKNDQVKQAQTQQEVKAPQEKDENVVQAQTVQEIDVAPEQVEDYNEQFEANEAGDKEKKPEQPKVEIVD